MGTRTPSSGLEAVLTNPEGRQLEFPQVWLPGDARPGARYRVTTQIDPADRESRFAVTMLPVAP